MVRWSSGYGACRRPIPETRVRSLVVTDLLTSLNLPVSSVAPDSNWNPVTLVAEDGSRGRFGGSSGTPSTGEEDSVTETLKHVKSSVARSGGIVLRLIVWRLWRRRLVPEIIRVRSPVVTHLLTSLNLLVSSLAQDSNWNHVTGDVTVTAKWPLWVLRNVAPFTQSFSTKFGANFFGPSFRFLENDFLEFVSNAS